MAAFNLDREFQKAWDWCWSYYCEPSVYENEQYNEKTQEWEKTGEKRELEPRQSWLTATDLERRVRASVAEQVNKVPYGSYGADAWGKGASTLRISTGKRGNLLDACRDWLLSQARSGKLSAHNFGRGHISGMRFRPVGLDLTEAEKKTVEKKAVPYDQKPVHFADPDTRSFRSLTLCSKATRETNKKKLRGYFRQPNRSKSRTTTDRSKVTCPRCLKLLQSVSAS